MAPLRRWSAQRDSIAVRCSRASPTAARRSKNGCWRSDGGWTKTLHEVLRRLLDHYVVTGAIDRAIQIALRLIALDPLQESIHRALIRLYMYQDRVGAALDQYRRCRDVLERELDVQP